MDHEHPCGYHRAGAGVCAGANPTTPMYRIRQLLPPEDVLCLPAETTVREACRRMEQARVGAAIVREGDREVAGIFSERDLMLRVVNAGKDPDTTRIGEVSTRDVITAAPDQRSGEVLRLMQTRHIRHLPVVEGGRVLGMLSVRHLLRADLEEKKNEVEAITAYIQGGVAHPVTDEDADSEDD